VAGFAGRLAAVADLLEVVGLAGHRAGLRKHIVSVARHHVLTL